MIEIRVETTEPLAGQIWIQRTGPRTAEGPVMEFCGWLGLISALRTVVEDDLPQPASGEGGERGP